MKNENNINNSHSMHNDIDIKIKHKNNLYNLILKTNISFKSSFRKKVVCNLEDINDDSFTGVFRLVDNSLVYQYTLDLKEKNIDCIKNESIARISSCKHMLEVFYG